MPVSPRWPSLPNTLETVGTAHIAQDAWAHAQQAPEYVPAPLPTHDDEVLAAHEGQPSITVQNATHGAGLPAVDRG
jgi:hypothetical protein